MTDVHVAAAAAAAVVVRFLEAVQAERILGRRICHDVGISQYLKTVEVDGVQARLQRVVRGEEVRVKRPRHPCHRHANVFHQIMP